MERRSLPAGWDLNRIQEVGQLRNEPRLLDPSTVVTIETADGPETVDATVIIDCGGLVLALEPVDGHWLMGEVDDDGVVRCWAGYGSDLAEALRSL